ncbi:MAG: bifunctional oligoribonuclease/PAP phosphatase NrnA [Bacilli bacterium]
MYNKIYKLIKKYDTILIARHVGVDPDAFASQVALRDSISLTFPNKKVYAVGNGSAKFSYIGKLDKADNYDDALLIVLDTPDKKRIDGIDFAKFKNSIKIDHHVFTEQFCDIEVIKDNASSTCEIILDLLYKTKLKINKAIAENLFMGLVSDSNRFLFNNSTTTTFLLVSKILKDFDLDIASLYLKMYLKPLAEVRMQGYIEQNLSVTEHGVGYIYITDEIINKFKADSASAGNMVNNFNYIEEVLVWIFVSEDLKNDTIRVSIRSRGPEINKLAEEYNGGGHKFASGIRINSFEEADAVVKKLDNLCEIYLKDKLVGENYENK